MNAKSMSELVAEKVSEAREEGLRANIDEIKVSDVITNLLKGLDAKMQECAKLRAALVGLVGSDDKDELLKIRKAMLTMEAITPEEDMKVSLFAIDTLLDTQPKKSQAGTIVQD
jgi:regulator of sirC expression with transglutaminase-like and TPR domain